jgi:hypothetical protein
LLLEGKEEEKTLIWNGADAEVLSRVREIVGRLEKITVNFAGTTDKGVPTWSLWSLGATVHANDWRNIAIALQTLQ